DGRTALDGPADGIGTQPFERFWPKHPENRMSAKQRPLVEGSPSGFVVWLHDSALIGKKLHNINPKKIHTAVVGATGAQSLHRAGAGRRLEPRNQKKSDVVHNCEVLER